jgi:prolyl oligopeptidase
VQACPHPQVADVALPFKGSAQVRTDPRVPGSLLNLTNWAKALKIYAYDPQTKRVTDTGIQPSGPYDNPSSVESVEVMVRSYDGIQVPLSIIYRKGMKFDGSNPTLFDGYGAYGIPYTPYFEPAWLAWHAKGGTYALLYRFNVGARCDASHPPRLPIGRTH